MPNPSKPLKSAFGKMTPKLVPPPSALAPAPAPGAVPETTPRTPEGTAANPAPKPSPAAASSVAPKPPKPLPREITLELELVSRTDRAVAGWAYLDKCPPSAAGLALVINLAHDGVAAAAKAGDALTLRRWCGLILAEMLYVGHYRPLLAALQARLRQELLPPEQREVRGILFLAETIARHPSVHVAGQMLATTNLEAAPIAGRTPLGSVPLP